MNFERPRDFEPNLNGINEDEVSQKENELEKEESNDLDLFIKKRKLYHGSATKNIRNFNKAGETTVGLGVYLTSNAEDALGYARARNSDENNNKNLNLNIYHASIKNIKILDLTKQNNIEKILQGFKIVLQKRLEKKDLGWLDEASISEAIESIDSKTINNGNLKNVVNLVQEMFTTYIESLGYDGLVTYEGGEKYHNRNHDTYLIFDPQKVKIEKEEDPFEDNFDFL